MKILFVVTESLTIPYTGIGIPILQTIDALSESCECHIVVVQAEADWKRSDHPRLTSQRFIDLKPNKLLRFFTSRKPHFVYDTAALRQALTPIVEAIAPDVIHVDLLPLAEVKSALGGVYDGRYVLSLNDSLILLFRYHVGVHFFGLKKRLFSLITYMKVRRYEAEKVSEYEAVRFVSKFDTAYAAKFSGRADRVWCIPNIVDFKKFAYRRCNVESRSMIYLGLGGSEVESELKKLIFDIETEKTEIKFIFKIAGRGYSDSFAAYCSARAWVSFIGPVVDSTAEYHRSAVLVNPVDKPCGLYNKYLEAMSCGLPCIGAPSSFNAFYPLGFAAGVHGYLLEPGNMTNSLNRILHDDEALMKCSEEAHAFVRRHYSPEAHKKLIEALYCEKS